MTHLMCSKRIGAHAKLVDAGADVVQVVVQATGVTRPWSFPSTDVVNALQHGAREGFFAEEVETKR